MNEKRKTDAMSYIGDDLVEEADSCKADSAVTVHAVAEGTKPAKRLRLGTLAGVAATFVILIELGIVLKLFNDNATPNAEVSAASTAPTTTTAARVGAIESTPVVIEDSDDIRVDFAWHAGESYGFDMELANKYFYGKWISENGFKLNDSDSLTFRPNGNADFCSSVTTIYSIFETNGFAYIYGSEPSGNFVVGIKKAEPDVLYYMDMFYIDENKELASANSEAVVPLHRFNKAGEAQNDESEALNRYGLLEISDESGIPCEMISSIDYVDENDIRWTRFDDGAVCPNYPIYLDGKSDDSYSFKTVAALYSEEYLYESNATVCDISYTISKTNGSWSISSISASEPYTESLSAIDNAAESILDDMLKTYGECRENHNLFQDMTVAEEYFYAEWLADNKTETIMLVPYGDSYGGSSSWLRRIFRMNDYAYIVMNVNGEEILFAIDVKSPDVMYLLGNIKADENGKVTAISEAVTYKRLNDIAINPELPITDFGLAKLKAETDIDTGYILYIEYVDENNVKWLREVNSSALQYIKLVSKADDSFAFESLVRSDIDGITYLRNISYTVSKSGDGWKQTINSVGEPFTS